MTLEEIIAKLSSGECFSDNIEDNIDTDLVLSFLNDLKDWCDNPFLMIKKHCEKEDRCSDCSYAEYCTETTVATLPEEWKF